MKLKHIYSFDRYAAPFVMSVFGVGASQHVETVGTVQDFGECAMATSPLI